MPRLVASLAVLLGLLKLTPEAPAQETGSTSRRPFVLTLHSYSPSDWDNGLQAGINQELIGPARIDLYVDHMDTRKVESTDYLEMLTKVYAVKYRNIRFDLIIVCDDAAYQFAIKNRSQLWPGTPVVFCGVNELRPEEFAHQDNFTGISENNDLRDFVAALPKMVPGLKTLYVIKDDSTYSRSTLPLLLAAINQTIPNIKVQYLDNSSLQADELIQRLQKIPPESAVFHLSFWRERTGRFINGSENKRILTQSTVPVFTSHQSLIGQPAVGASFVDATDQGTAAGRIARTILTGTPTREIPARAGPARRMVFDYATLQRFHIPASTLPAGSTIINEPYSFYRKYRTLVWTTLTTISVLSLLVILLVTLVLQRRSAIARLTESEDKFNAFMSALPGFAYIRDAAGNNHFVNAAMRTVFGLTSRHTTPPQTTPQAQTGALASKTDDERVLATLQPVVSEQNVAIGDQQHTYLTTKFPLLRKDQPPLIAGLAIDITPRKKVEAALRENQHFIESVLDTTPDVVYIYDLQEKRNVFSNHEIVDILGYSPDAIAAMGDQLFVNLLHPDDLPHVTEHHRKVASSHSGYHEIDYRMRDSKGAWRWLHSRDKVFSKNPDGTAKQIIGTASDITEQKSADLERASLQAQLNQAQKMDSIGRLAGGVAHDFNNMLTAIQINATLAREALPPDSPLCENLDEVLQCTRRSTDLTQRLLAFARKQTVAPRLIDLNTTVEGLLKMLQRLIGEDIHLLWQPTADLWPIKLDPSQIDQVLTNLCINARDAIAGVGKVTILTKNTVFDAELCNTQAGFIPGDYVLLSLNDNGCGMDKEVLGHLFEPFFTTKPPGQGTGLGLATVYGIVKQNRGFINVYSEPGHGTTINVYLPRTHASPELQTTANIAPVLSHGHETILLVEDEPSIMQISKRALGKFGYNVLAAATPNQAVELAATHPGEIHLLMTDVVMPEMNGRDLSRRICALRPNIKCLYMSGYTSDVIAHQGILEEGIVFMQKPFSLQDLASKVRSALL